MIVLGIDPDLTDVGMALWTSEGPSDAWTFSPPANSGLKDEGKTLRMLRSLQLWTYLEDHVPPDIVCVEGQSLNHTRHKRPDDIIKLAQVAGMVAMRCRMQFPSARILFPSPQEWTGSVPKGVRQARMYTKLDWGYDMCAGGKYAVPRNAPFSLTKTQWKHAGDALGLAQWAIEQ